MSTQNLVIYKLTSLYLILKEIRYDINFMVKFAENQHDLNEQIKNIDNYLIISNEENLNFQNQFNLKNLPINIFKLIEKVNVEFLKTQFSNQSSIKINNYVINLNSREVLLNQIKIKLTEKEIDTIIYLSKSDNPVTIDELQKKVWSYKHDIETHTVETHIYRLRKKFLNTFNDDQFIISKKNGYQIKK
ncbi:winged helix-turn-helix domain-containing protein [Candidatus Pelagibacter sp. HIMB1748]|uniref:winged helix-turn-helix domain-containing protein n=1 Tax=unclassified Candidatus Pelagibacter TaxID=2647897 RepID=UPI003F836141